MISPSRPRLNPTSFRPAGRGRPLPAAVVCLLVAAVLAVLALTACGGEQPAAAATGGASIAATAAPELADVTLIMDWVPWVLDIPVDVAQEQGFYTDAGLSVKQTLPGGPTDVVKFVATGKAQFGLYYAPDTLMGIGEGAPLLSVAGLMTHAPVGMAMAPGVRASEPADLAGTTAGVVLIPSTRASFTTMLETGGVEPGDVKVVDPGFDLVPPLLAGKYDSVAVTEFGELVQADAAGEKLDYLDFRDWGTPDYAFLNVLTQQGFASDNPATVRAFVTATMQGLDYAVAHPEEAVDIYVKRHPELERDLLLAQWKAAIPSMAVADGAVTGIQKEASWQSLQDWMVASGLLKQAVDTATVVTNDYLPEQ